MVAKLKEVFILFFLIVAIFVTCQAQAEVSLEEVKNCIQQGKIEEAITELKEILSVNPDLGEAHLLLGQLYQKKAEIFLQKAIEEYRKATKDEKTSYLAEQKLAKLLLTRGDFEETIDILSRLKKEKKEFEVMKLLGLAYFKSGQLTQALENLEKANSLNPRDAEVLFYLGRIYEEKKLFPEALESYEKIVSMYPSQKLTQIAQKRIENIKQERKGLTVAEIEDPEVREIILNSPSAEEYPEAGAAILLNEHEYIVKEDNTMVEKIHRIIKIFNVRGREKYGEIQIDYDSTYQRVEIDYARTIKPDGTIVKVGKKDIKDVDRWAEFPLYSNAKVKIISMPEVVEDSIIEYKASIFTSKLINEDDFQFRYGIQYFEPCLRHKLKLVIPRERKVNIHYVRLKEVKPEISESSNLLIYEWKIENVPEIIAEPNMPPWADISPFIMVSSFKSWEEFSRWWRNLSQGQAEPTPEIEKKVQELIEGKMTQEEKARAIYNWVVSNIRYVGLEFGIAGFKPHSAGEVFNNKYGDCKDKTTLLIAMFKSAKIPAYYALIGTREMGKLEKEIPMSQFNHAICVAEIDGNLVWLDPTAETASFGEIPGADQEKLALVFFPEKAEFLRVPLVEAEKNKIETRMEIWIKPDASIEARMKILTSGVNDMEFRTLKYVKPARRKQLIENWINTLAPGAKLISYSFSDLDNLDIPVSLEINFSAPDYLKKAGDVWLFNIPGIQIEAGIVGKEKRIYSLTFFTTSLSVDKAKIYVPSTFKVSHLPENVSLQSEDFYFSSSYDLTDGAILYEGIFGRKISEISVSSYPDYKDFMEEVSRTTQKPVVLIKLD